LRVDQQGNLRHADAQQRRNHQLRDISGPRFGIRCLDRAPAQSDIWQQPKLEQRWDLHGELKHTAHHHANAQRIHRLNTVCFKVRRTQPSSHDHRYIQKHRGGCWHRKTSPCVEHTRRQRHERHEANIGKHPAGHEHRRFEPPGVLLQATGHGPHQNGRGYHANHAGHQQSQGQQRGHAVNQLFGFNLAVLNFAGSQHRHKRLAERALGKKSPEQVGNAKCNVEGVRHGTGAEGRGNQQFTNQPGDA